MIATNRFGHHLQAWDFDRMQGSDLDDFMAEVESGELAEGDDPEAALDEWRQQQEDDGEDVLECGLSRNQLRTAAKVLFHGLAEVLERILLTAQKSHSRCKEGGSNAGRMGAKVSASHVAGVGVALQLPGFERSAEVARRIQVTRAGVSLHAAEFGRMLGVTSETSARRQLSGLLARTRHLAGLAPSHGGAHLCLTKQTDKEPQEIQQWLSTLPENERETARLALRGRVA